MTPDETHAPEAARRRTLAWLAALGAAVSAAITGVPAFAAFLSPAFRRAPKSSWIKLGETALLDIGVPVKRDFTQTIADAWVEGRVQNTVWLYTDDGESFTAFHGRCPHLGCGYDFNQDKQQFHCPCHHGIFDAKSGAVLGGPPPRGLDPLPVKIVDGEVLVEFKNFRAGIAERIET